MRANLQRLDERSGQPLSDEELDARVAAICRATDPSSIRQRIKGHQVEEARVFHRRDGDETVRYSNGLVELANLPDFDFDFRVRFELIEGRDGPVLAPAAIAVVARRIDGEVEPHAPGEFAQAGIARAVREAARLITMRFSADDEGYPLDFVRASGADVERALPRIETPLVHRRSSRQVDDEATKAAAKYRELCEPTGRPPAGYAAKIAASLGLWGSGPGAESLVRKRIARAQRMGLLPGAAAAGSKRRPSPRSVARP